MTKVVFRKFKDGDIIALFPDLKERRGNITCYQHIGMHGIADRGIVKDTKLATESEYKPLYKELERIGYSDLQVVKRLNKAQANWVVCVV